jgi:hypothetical protein
MNTSLVAGYLTGITSEQLDTATTKTASIEVVPIASRQHYTDESLMNVWVMIGTIFCCLALMIAVVIATAASMS